MVYSNNITILTIYIAASILVTMFRNPIMSILIRVIEMLSITFQVSAQNVMRGPLKCSRLYMCRHDHVESCCKILIYNFIFVFV